MRVDEHERVAVEQPNARARALGGAPQDRLVPRVGDRYAAREVVGELLAHEHRLIAHIALERVEELPLVEPRKFEPGDGHEQHHEIDREQPSPDSPESAHESAEHQEAL